MPQTVIVPLDGSDFAERALAPAAELARRSGARVVVLTARYGGVVVEPRLYLEEAARAAGIDDPEPLVIEGRLAASSIVDVVAASADPVVCMATHARRAAGKAVFGSVAEEALRRIAAPIVLVGPSVPETRPKFAEFVVGVDGSSLAEAMLPVAAAWARELGLSLTVVTVAESASPDQPHGHGEDGEAAAMLERVAQRVPGWADAVREVLHGTTAADAIVDFVTGRPGALLGLTTHGRSGVARVIAGSVTMEVVRRAPCVVVTLRPPGVD